MGRLKLSRRSLTLICSALLGLAVILAIFLYFKAARLTDPTTKELVDYLKHSSLNVSTATVQDFEQVYYSFNGRKIYITEGEINRNLPVASQNFVVWTETPYQQNSSLVVLYDVLTKTKTQLTFYGTSSRPQLNGNKVVWEDNTNTTPQIYYYDGVKTTQLSKEYPSVHPAIRGNQILYAQEIAPASWQIIMYNTDKKESKIVSMGDNTHIWPRFEGDKITTNNPIY